MDTEFRAGRQERKLFCMKESRGKCMVLGLGKVKSRELLGQTDMGSIVVVVCYITDQEEDIHETFFRQLEEASCLQALVFRVYLHHLSICWKGKAAGHLHPGGFWSASVVAS